MMWTRMACAVVVLGFAGAAQADLISMSEASCRNAQKGAACQGDSGPGTCQPGRCCRNDYSNGPPPRSVCSDCLTCQTGAAPPAEPAPAEPAPAAPPPAAPADPFPAAPAAPPPAEPVPAAPPPAEPAPAAPPPAEPAPTPAEPAPAEKRGCDAAAADPLAPIALGLGLLLALGLRRSRR